MSEGFDSGRLAEELRVLMSEAEALLRSASRTASAAEGERAEALLADLRARLGTLEQQLKDRARDVDDYVRENPWQALAVVGGVALLLGLLMGRK
ncbi:MAG TPA: hypothetical protein VET46_03770 [Steroidobacteraceae bacterium]|nr:hypothetical protein [Steroidobacteraceae bacterium]